MIVYRLHFVSPLLFPGIFPSYMHSLLNSDFCDVLEDPPNTLSELF